LYVSAPVLTARNNTLLDATPAPEPTNVQPVPAVIVGTPVLVATKENSTAELTFALLMSAFTPPTPATAGSARSAVLLDV
jgi:hypothetical protein